MLEHSFSTVIFLFFFVIRATQTLSEEQTQWVKTSEEKVYQLIRETPPGGDKFADIVKVGTQKVS